MSTIFSPITIIPETLFLSVHQAGWSQILASLSLCHHDPLSVSIWPSVCLVADHNHFLELNCWIDGANVGHGNKQRENHALRKSHYSYALLLEGDIEAHYQIK